jgi:hypothetical protein
MRIQNANHLYVLADSQKDRFAMSKAVVESGRLTLKVVTSGKAPEMVAEFDAEAMRAKLIALGCEFEKNPTREFEHVVQIQVHKDGVLLACGTAGNEGEALLHAMLGFVRERNIDGLKAQGMTHAQAVAGSIGGSAQLT